MRIRSRRIGESLLLIMMTATAAAVKAQEVTKTVMQPINVVYVTDTALAMESFTPKMGKHFGTLFTLVNQQQLKPGKVMAIYHSITSPWVFDVAVEVDKVPVQLTGGVQFKTISGGEAVVVHYKGPYEKIEKAYMQIDEWLRRNNKQKAGPVMEVYLNDPARVKDKNELLTDVYQLIK